MENLKQLIEISKSLSNQIEKTLEPVNSINRSINNFRNIILRAYTPAIKMQAIKDNIKNNSFSKVYKDIEKFKNRINNFYNIFKTLENLNKITLIRLNKPILHIQKPFYINSLKGYQGSINSPPVKNKKELINLLFNDLRVDTDLFLLCDLYDYVFYLSRNTEFKRKVAWFSIYWY